jgi:hypothetical protein
MIAKSEASDPTDFVVNGVIIKTDKKLDSKCKIELFYENKLVDSSIIRMNRPFEYRLKKNVWYTLRVTKEGFLPLTVSFNTEVGNEEILQSIFHFATELIPLSEAQFLNPDLIDFPVGIVSLNKKTKKFEANGVYTDNHLTGLNKAPEIKADIVKEYVSRPKVGAGMC